MDSEMKHFGSRFVSALCKTLKLATGAEVTPDNRVLLLEDPLFKGDPILAKDPKLQSYVKKVHPHVINTMLVG
jgi:hypothetical protein